MNHRVAFGPTIAVLAFVSLAACEDSTAVLKFAGSPTPTVVSGPASSNVQVLSVAGGEFGVQKITWREGGFSGGLDQPCFLEVGFRRLADFFVDTFADDELTNQSVNVCNNNSYTNSSGGSVNLAFSKESFASGQVESWHLYLNEIQTCNSVQSGNDRIKGIFVLGSFINGVTPNPSDYECHISGPNYSFSRPCNEEEVRADIDDQTNCGMWNPLVTCPAGTIASGVRVHVQNTNEIVGLAMDCDTVVSVSQ